MANTRRTFLQSAVLAAGITEAAAEATAQTAAPQQEPGGRGGNPAGQAGAGGRGGPGGAGRGGPGGGERGGASTTPPAPVSEVQVPHVKFGPVEISRLIIGYNPFHGQSHNVSTLNAAMIEYYTPARVVEDLHRCARFGINTCSLTPSSRAVDDHALFQSEGGKMNIIFQGDGDPSHPLYKSLKPAMIYHHGENTDSAFQNGTMDTVKTWCKKQRDAGMFVGVGSHIPEALALVEEENWDVDFLYACVYGRRRTEAQRRELLNNENPIGELFLVDDPPRMYKILKQSKKPCIAYKVLAAGRVNPQTGFKQAFDSLKPGDCVCAGVFTKYSDQIRQDAQIVHDYFAQKQGAASA